MVMHYGVFALNHQRGCDLEVSFKYFGQQKSNFVRLNKSVSLFTSGLD